MAFYAKNYLQKMADTKNINPEDSLIEKTKGNFKAAAIGAGLGLVIGYTKGYNLLLCAVIGGGAAALLSNYILKKSKANEE